MSLENSHGRPLEESLSALLDNEADELELRRLLKKAPQDKELAETWRRFNLVKSVLHHEEVASVSADSTQRLFSAIAAEETYVDQDLKPTGSSASSLWTGVGRMAIAASVAFAAFIGFQNYLETPAGTAPMAVQEVPPAETVQLANAGNGTVEFDAAAQQRLNDYIRSASIQYSETDSDREQFNILEDSQLIRQVNQIEP